jgi:hypothetical protein
MNSKLKTLLAAAGLVVALAGAAGAAQADTRWQAHHPYREQVNTRLATQNFRINQERRSGDISAARAWRLHMADLRIRMQERWFASHDRGHITRAEQMRLNQHENRVSHRIG